MENKEKFIKDLIEKGCTFKYSDTTQCDIKYTLEDDVYHLIDESVLYEIVGGIQQARNYSELVTAQYFLNNALMSACEKLADFIFVEGLDND